MDLYSKSDMDMGIRHLIFKIISNVFIYVKETLDLHLPNKRTEYNKLSRFEYFKVFKLSARLLSTLLSIQSTTTRMASKLI